MLKHLPKKFLDIIRNYFLFSEKDVNYPNRKDRRVHGQTTNTAGTTDNNPNDRIAKFANQIKNKYVYRIPLKYICDIRKINFPTKIDTKIRLTLETDIKKLFESSKSFYTAANGNTPASTTDVGVKPDAKIILLKAPRLRLRVWVYTNGEYIYLLHDGSLTLKYKTYTFRSHY